MTKSKTGWLRRISEWGIPGDHSVSEDANHIRVTNILLLCLSAGSVVETIACFASGAWQAGLLNSTAPLVFGGGLLLMRSGHTVLARMLVLVVSHSAGYAMATMLGPESLFQLVILFASAFTLTFFPLNYRKSIAAGLILPLASFCLLELTHYAPILGLARTPISTSHLVLFRIMTVSTIWIAIIAQVIYLQRSRTRSQERLVSSAKMVALGQMAAGIAHEVNNPLHQIVGHAERLSQLATQGPVPADQAEAIADRIQSISMRIGAIVHGLQGLARDASSDPFEEIPLQSLLRLTLGFCQARISSHEVLLEVDEIPETWTVVGREAQLSEVLLNLLNNALDATLESRERLIRLEAQARDGVIEIAVANSGPSIPEPVRQRMFDPFFTTKGVGRGTGLGLSISRRIMAAHRGALIHDEAAPETRFVIRVPRGRDSVTFGSEGASPQ